MLASDNPLNPFFLNIIKIMTINDQIRDEKRQYDINREAAKTLVLHLTKLISMNIFLVKNYYHLIKNK